LAEVLFKSLDETKKSHDQIAVLQDGRVIAMGKNWKPVVFTSCDFIEVRVPDLRMIEYVLNVQFYTTPLSCAGVTYQDKKITGNVVGMTIYGSEAVGVTLTVEVIAIGPP